MRALSDNMEQTAREISMADDGMNDRAPVARRDFLLGAGTAVAAGLAPASAGSAEQSSAGPAPAAAAPEPDAFVTLTTPEAAFVVAAVDTIIPADELSPAG